MPRLPSFDRGLVVVPPHGDFIIEGRKKVLVKSRRYRMSGERLLVIQQKKALGIIVLGEPREIPLSEFARWRPAHLVSEAERKKWWGGKKRFWLFPVRRLRRLRAPIPVSYLNGAQVFARRQNIKVARKAHSR